MRFHLGEVPESADFSPDATWTPLREPTPWVSQFLALPLGIVACVAIGYFWFFLTPLEVSFDAPGMMVAAFVAIIPIHELIHAAAHPRSGMSSSSILGIWPSHLLFYAHYTGELSRGRFVAMLLMPFLIISIVPLFACAIFTGQTSGLLAFTSILNALLACGDLFAVALLLFQVPSNAIVRNQGWRTFWRTPEHAK